MKRYTKEFLLSFAAKESCNLLPQNLDPALFRESPSPDIVDGGGGNKFVSRREQELPEWRNRGTSSGGNGGGGLLSHHNQPRRRSQEDEASFKGPSSWSGGGGGGEAGGHLRGRQGPGHQSRWEHRGGNDREREQGDSGSRPRFAWSGSSEHDGLLGSGGGLRGPYPGGRAPDRYNNSSAGRGTRANDSRSSKPASGGYRNDADDLDGETFGDKSSTKDRSEEERRRREEFECMRKEQQRMKEQKKPEKLDNFGLVDESSTSSGAGASSESKPEATSSAPSSTPRPLVPPGFSQANLQKPSLKSDKKERAAEEQSEKNHQPVDPVAIACSITENDVFSLAESSKANLIDKIFSKAGSAPTPQSEKPEARTSKFAHLFNFEDESSLLTSPRSPVAAEAKPSDSSGGMLPMPVAPSVEDVEKSLEGSMRFSTTPSRQRQQQQQQGKTFLTCEDIEQSLLAEASTRHESPSPAPEIAGAGWKREPGAGDANAASRHLLSLLQKPAPGEPGARGSVESEAQGGVETPATLETLFGMSFMMELRSKDAPLSVKAVSETRNEAVEFPASRKPDADQQLWASLWGGKPENPRNNNTPATMENGDWAAGAGNGELDSGVLNDFLKFKKAMNHRNKVNDSFLGMNDDQTTTAAAAAAAAGAGGVSEQAPAPPAAGLYRSHSPPLINQRSSVQLQQLKQVLVSQGSKLAAAKQQQQNVFGNGELNPENRFARARPPQLSRQQQAMFEQAQQQHLVALPPGQGFPPGMLHSSSKQRPLHHHLHQQQQQQQHLPAGYFPPNAGVLPPHLAPPGMSFGHLHPHQHHHHPHPGFPGVFPEVFMDHPAAASAAGGENRWIGREASPHHPAAAVAGAPGLFPQQQQQQQASFGMNKLGYP